MQIRNARSDELSALAEIAAPLQRRPDRHLPYLSVGAEAITQELIDLGEWWTVSAVAVVDGSVAAWLVGDVDLEVGRVWWLGPFVDSDWAAVADRLYSHAESQLPSSVDEEEFAITPDFVQLRDWGAGHGFVAGLGSIALATTETIPAAPVAARLTTAADIDSVGALHDRLFPNLHYTGRQIIEGNDDTHIRLATEVDGETVGYVVVEHQPDNSGYIDFLGVAEGARRQGLGAGLVAAGVAELRSRGCERIHLSVRDDNTDARALYRSLGFEEEVVLVPLRKGFTVS